MSGLSCVHCGDDCGKYPITWDEKNFCCDGCKSVYEILNKHRLYDYYKIENSPGIKITTKDYHNKFAYLDIDEIRDKLFDFAEGNKKKATLFIPAIHCSSCIWLLENLPKLHGGISHSIVNFIKKEVTITFDSDKISLRQLVELLASIHYIPHISLESVEKKKNETGNKQLLYKIGIAGFAFGNAMLFSFPEYVPGSETIDFSYKYFFGFLNLFLAIPVFFYCGNDYLISAYKNIKKKIINIDFPIAIGLVAIFTESCYEIFSHTGSGYMDSLAGLVFFLLIGKWYQAKTYQTLSFDRDYKSYFPIAVTTIRDDKETSIPIETLKENDVIQIRNQELIPADSVLISDTADIDYSFVTGESEPVKKTKGEFIYAGGKQSGSTIKLLVKTNTQQSRLTQLWNHSYEKHTGSTLTKLIDSISHRFTIVVLLIAFSSGIFWLSADPKLALKAFTSVLIVACPCALVLSIPFTYSNIMRVFGNRGLYLKKNEVIENLFDIDVVVFDKTGTITQPDAHDITFEAAGTLDEKIMPMVASLSKHSTHPLSQAVFQYLGKYYPRESGEVENFREYSGQGVSGIISGSLVKIGSEKFIHNTTSDISVADTTVHVSVNNNYTGKFILKSKLRDQLDPVIKALKCKGYQLHLLSGDSIRDRQLFEKYFGENMYFRQEPEDKLNYIKALQEKGHKVLMIGDGLNDAGALLQSRVGISVADNIYHFSPACDAILKADSFKDLESFVSFSKTARKIVQASFVFSFLYNSIGLFFAVRGLLSPVIAAILMPLSSVTVVGFVTVVSTVLLKRHLPRHNP